MKQKCQTSSGSRLFNAMIRCFSMWDFVKKKKRRSFGFGLFVGQNKTFEDVTFLSGKQ